MKTKQIIGTEAAMGSRIRAFFHRETEHILYWLGIWAGLGTAALLAFIRITGVTVSQCRFRRLTGIICPGCGGSRALIALLHGNLLQAIFWHPLVPWCAAIYLMFMGSQLLQRVTGGKIRGLRFHAWYLYAALAILAVQYLLKLCIPGYVV